MSRNHLSGRSFLQRGACRAADVCLESKLVTELNDIVGIVSVKKIRVNLANTRLIDSLQPPNYSSFHFLCHGQPQSSPSKLRWQA